MTRVRDVLDAKGTDVLMVPPDTLVMRVAQRMRLDNVGAFVVSSDGHRVDGLITERDIVAALARHGPALLHLPASAVMSHVMETCTPADSVRFVMETMTRARVRHLPVVDHGQLCGLVSIGDVIKHYVEETHLESRVMRDAYLAHRAR